MPGRNVERGAVGGFGFTKTTGLVMSHRTYEKFVELGLCVIRHVLTNSQGCSYGYTGAESRSIPRTLLNAIYGLCAAPVSVSLFSATKMARFAYQRILARAQDRLLPTSRTRQIAPPGVRCFVLDMIALKESGSSTTCLECLPLASTLCCQRSRCGNRPGVSKRPGPIRSRNKMICTSGSSASIRASVIQRVRHPPVKASQPEASLARE